MNDFLIILAMALYMAVVVGIGIMYSKKNKTSEDYFLGGRSLGPWVTAMSAEASDMSSWLLMGLPGLAYISGFCDAGWTAIGLVLGTLLNWWIVAKKLRTYTYMSKNSFTLPDFFSNRFRDEKKILMTISSIFMVVFFTVYTASGFSACGKLFHSLFGYNYIVTMIICGVVIILYTSIGGFLAASTTDLIQGLLMSFAIITVLIVGVANAGGIGEVIDNGKSLAGYFSLTQTHDSINNVAKSYGLLTVVSGLSWGLGYFGMPHILVRFMAIKNVKEIRKSRNIAMIWVVISLFVAVCIGFTGATLYPGLLSGGAEETIFIVMTQKLLPIFLVGIVMSGILAATMSTADSQLLMVSSSIAQNLFKGIIKKNATEKQVLLVSRGTTIAGMVTGGTVSIVWSIFISKLGGWFGVYSLLPAFVISSIVIVVVSLITKEPSKEITDEFEAVGKEMRA